MFDVGAILQPKTIAEALTLYQQHPEAIVISGGTDVLIKLREGKMAGSELLSIHEIPELAGVTQTSAGDLEIGPRCHFHDLETDPLILQTIPVLGQAAGTVGGPQIRAMGTVGGNVCNGVTSADTASTLTALEAELTLQSATGTRQLPIEQFYLGPGKVDLQAGELLTKSTIRAANFAGLGGYYYKYAMREAMDIATLGCVVLVKPDAAGKVIERVRVAFGVAYPVPTRAKETEQALTGLTLAEAEARIAGLVRAEIKPRDSWRASKAFRLQIAGEIATRALGLAWQQALERRG